MKKIIEDIKAYSNGSLGKILTTIILNPNFHCILIYRVAHFLGKLKMRILPRILRNINRVIYNVDIDYRADLAGGFQLIHGLGVVIGCNVVSLGPIKVYQGVTLGGNSGKESIWNNIKISQPILYGGVILYADAAVIGPVIIGENSIIGTKSLIMSDVEENKIVYCKFQREEVKRSRL